MSVDLSWHYHRKEIGRIKVLTHKEMIDLFKRLYEIKEELKQKSIKDGEKVKLKREVIEIRNKIAEGNLRLVTNIARKFLIPNEHLKFLDLIQEGSIGLFKAIDGFDYRKGFRFSTYAMWWITASIIKLIYENGNIIKVPFRIREIFNKIEKTRKILEKENGREMREDALYDAVINLGVISGKDLDNFQKSIIRETVFLDDLIEIRKKYGNNGSGKKFLIIEDMMKCDSSQTPENILINLEMKKEIRRLLAVLTPQEEAIIKRRFGIDFFNAQTLQEIGDGYGLSRERIRQIEKLALKKLKKLFLAEELCCV